MIKETRLTEEAEVDLSEASIWYQQQQRGLGDEFLDEVLAESRSIQNHPFAYPVIHREVRRALTHRFPRVFYRVEEELIVVLAIMHASRDPNRWKRPTISGSTATPKSGAR
ncbi:MAG: toxin ParE1/3/4 [Gammaproteobacteria bacterium]|jgi:toxin ParE1/3/4